MASTAWTIQLRIMSASTAPKLFGSIAAGAKRAAAETAGLEKALKGQGAAAKGVTPEIKELDRATRSLARANGRLPDLFKNVNSGLTRVQAGFQMTGRSAANFSRTTRSAAAVAASSFGGLTSSVNSVRTTFNAATASVRHLSSAISAVPKLRTPAMGPTAAGAGHGAGNPMDARTLGLAAAGALAGGALMSGIRGASELQGTTLQAAIGGGRMGGTLQQSTTNMRDIREIAFSMSTMTGQSIADSMGVVASMATAGVSLSQLKTIYKPIAQFTDVLHFGKDKMDYGEAAKMGAGIVHDMRFFTPEDTAYGLGRVAQLAYLSPHGTNQLVTQIRRFAPTFENILPGTNRQKADTITDFAAWGDRTGNLPFLGAALSQLATQMIAPRSERVMQSWMDLGVWKGHWTKPKHGGKPHIVLDNSPYWNQKTGTWDMMGAMHHVQLAVATGQKRGDAGKAVTAILGNTQNAARILQALSSKEALTAYDRVVAQRKAMGADPVAWMDRVQTQLMSQLSSQTLLLKSNFQTLTTMIGDQLLPVLTPFVSALASITGNVAGYLKDHPRAARASGIALASTAAVGGVAALALGGYIATGAFRWLGHLLKNEGLTHGLGNAASAAVRGGGWRAGLGVAGVAAATGLGRLGRIGIGITGLGLFASIGKLFSGMAGPGRVLAAVFGIMGPRALMTGVGLRALGGFIARLGFRAIPVVGNILLLIDTLKFLGAHSFDIGKALGMAARWVVDHGVTMLVNAFKTLLGGIRDFVVGSISGFWTGSGKGGIWDVLSNAKKGWDAGYRGGHQDLSEYKDSRPPISGGRGGGMPQSKADYPRLQSVPPASSHGKVSHIRAGHAVATAHTTTHRIVLASEGPHQMSNRDLRTLAQHLAGIIGNDVALDSRSAGATPAMSGHSTYSVIQGVPA